MVTQSLNNLSYFHKSQLNHASGLNSTTSLNPSKSHPRDEMKEALSAIQGLDLTVEVCGSWLWIFDANASHEARLRAANFNWSYRKGCWYLCPKTNKPGAVYQTNRQPWDHEKIQSTYGSQALRV